MNISKLISIVSGGSVTINGQAYKGKSVQIQSDGIVIVDGVVQGAPLVGPIAVAVNGDVSIIEATVGDITVSGSAGSVKATSGDVRCGDVAGNVQTMSGDISCGSIGGAASTMSGDINHR